MTSQPPDPVHDAPSLAAGNAAYEGRKVIGLVVALTLILVAASGVHRLTTVAVIAVVAGVIMLHETGHFVAAKLSGMKVTEFFLGFGPRLWSVRKGETEYGIKLIVIGGYVKVLGMNNLELVDPADEPRTCRQQSFPRRFAVFVAGSSVHFALALIAAWSLFAFAQQKPAPIVSSLLTVSSGPLPAQKAGLEPGDRIVSYDGHLTNGQWAPVHAYLQGHIDQTIQLGILRKVNGNTVTLDIPVTTVDESKVVDDGQPLSTDHVGLVGFSAGFVNYSLLGSIPRAARSFWDDGVVAAIHELGSVFSPKGLSTIGHQDVSAPGTVKAAQAGNRVTSVVGIVGIADQIHDWPTLMLLFFEANAFIGVLNLMPVLPFDGGHVVMAVYERIRSRKGRRYMADATKMLPYAFAAIVVFGFVMLSSVYLDVTHPISLH